MSNETTNGTLAPHTEPSALKSLLNPVQSEGATPSSTVPEPPKSPQPDLMATAAADQAPVNNQSDPIPPPAVENATTAQNGTDTSLPPLPIDASVPPSPKAADEPPPTLPEGAIPPAVATPTVITDGMADPMGSAQPPAALEPAQTPVPGSEATPATSAAPAPEVAAPPPPPAASQLETAPASLQSAPSGVVEPAPTPVEPVAPAPAPSTSEITPAPSSDAMEVDQPASSSANLKRPADDVAGGDEKRTRDGEVAGPAQAALVAQAPAPAASAAPVQAASAVSASSAPPPAAPAIAPGVGTVPVAVPPPPVASGPTTPFTLTQHKHMLSSVRSLKKNKDGVFFLEPVDPIKFNIPSYPVIITNPMDLGTVETKLIVSDPRGPPKDKSKMGKWDQSKGKYNSVADVTLDIRQIFWNTLRFNGPDHMVTQSAMKLDNVLSKMVANMPPEPIIAPPPAPIPAAGPSTARRPSFSHAPVIRRTSDATDRPKREIHPPPSKDLAYADVPRKPKRRNDPQLQWALRLIKQLESTNKTYDIVQPFLYPAEQLIAMFPDYASVIKKPIDLLIIKQRLTEGEYDDISQVDADMRLMFANALRYNAAQDPVAIAANQFQQLWTEKLKSVPPKYVSRDSSEDPAGAEPEYDSEDEHDEKRLQGYRDQIAEIQGKMERIQSRQAQRHASRPKKQTKKAPAPVRKSSGTRASPSFGNGHAKKPRKQKEYRDDEDDGPVELTPSQKEDLANKIQAADANILNKALEIIARSQEVATDGEIELDIEALPRDALLELYSLVVGPVKKGRKSNYVPTGRKPGRKAGGPRKSMNEEEEVLRIARMEEQLQSFSRDAGDASRGAQAATGYEDNDSESSEEEDSDLD